MQTHKHTHTYTCAHIHIHTHTKIVTLAYSGDIKIKEPFSPKGFMLDKLIDVLE